MISNTEQKLIYSASILLSTDKKTAESLANISGVSGDTMLRMLQDSSVKPEELILMAIQFFGTNYLKVILDDTVLEKMYSQLIEGSSDNYDASTGHVYRSLCGSSVYTLRYRTQFSYRPISRCVSFSRADK